MRKIQALNIEIANDLPFVLIAGPCQTESLEHSLMLAEKISQICNKLDIGFIYKSSFDKANRSSVSGKRGLGLEKTLPIFAEIKKRFSCPILTDIHNEEQCRILGNRDEVDILQIPAFLCRQTDLIEEASKTQKIINVKKGQFLAPWDAENIVKKFDHFNNKKLMLTERGVSFGYNTLVSDMRSLPIMAKTTCPVVFDATHSVQQPGGLGGASGGQREFVDTLASAAVAVGIAGLFMEVHQDPDNAPSDGPCMLRLDSLEKLLTKLKKFDKIVKNY
ncbi:2-dehydro-3-deoxyphosphooctonate aldolase [Alphaproteobacteria bacterium]|nr:2-dehydro-3-deoxyphosphooctonate aldolase [Alphaproteobacteria bacterium]